ncbi:hypothetical protein BDQ12DRAFT_680821 [Crucibulum laeve]|uniref:Uncharacterized protein n=1 Tax=Crucibulum laeve TaxID=68775 RepID=A0A5C3MGU4_9AGAR|nr:hypothetical protein BDQ12DRAFT_680821 [Crucibulum laeve]
MASESTTASEVDEEEDSLFGSPPPSPGRSQAGRSPSPALALPSSVNGMSSATQNVGTIALPGSHPYSELPVNPLALSLSHPTVPRPPAQGVNPPHWAQQQAAPACPPSVASSPSRSQSAAPPTRPRKKTIKSKSKESTPRLPGPEIPLPDPSIPPPANFLRNQSALLGTAGLVGGVKPAKLSTHRQNRGTTASNPIVVEDEEETPVIGRSRFRHPYIKPIDPSLLPAPTNQEIVAMLIGQKDIFPVLENILKLIAAGSSEPAPNQQQQQARASSSNNSRSSSAAPPLKKRKLNRVPAGATDWDVPYPFAQGEGPDAYRTTWERERGKQLISQLVNLIKTAARKAATKNYLRDEEVRRKMLEEQWRTREDEARKQEELRVSAAGEKRVRGYYRPATAVYGLEGEEARAAIEEMHEVLADNSNGRRESRLSLSEPAPPLPPPPPSNTDTPTSIASSQSQPSTPFDQLISSLLAASPQQGLPSANMPSANTNALFSPNYQASVNLVPSTPSTSIISPTQSSEGVDQALFDSWMNVLQSFPVPSEGFTQAQSLDAQTPSAMSAASPSASDTFGFFDDGGFNFGSMGMDFGDPSTGGSLPEFDALMASFPQQPDVDNGMDIDSVGTPKQLPMDHLIDPQLLSISIPQPLHPANISGSSNSSTQPPSLAPSPIPSTSSFGGNHDPLTPTSATWDISLPDVFTGTENTMQDGSIEARQDGEHDDQVSAMLAVFDNIPKDIKGKRREVLPVETVPEYQPQLEQAEPSPPPPLSPATTSTSRPSESRTTLISSASLLSVPPMLAALNVKKNSPLIKADILKRARERRLQILEELQRVKIQLWETTIEQGALAHLVKFYNDIETTKV